jgi:hypothetical protein
MPSLRTRAAREERAVIPAMTHVCCPTCRLRFTPAAAAHITACPECGNSPQPIASLERTFGFPLVDPRTTPTSYPTQPRPRSHVPRRGGSDHDRQPHPHSSADGARKPERAPRQRRCRSQRWRSIYRSTPAPPASGIADHSARRGGPSTATPPSKKSNLLTATREASRGAWGRDPES